MYSSFLSVICLYSVFLFLSTLLSCLQVYVCTESFIPAGGSEPETHVTTRCIKLSLQWFIIMNHENSQPVQCLWVSPLHTNIHSHTDIKKRRESRERRGRGWNKNNATVTETFSFAKKSVHMYNHIWKWDEANCTSIEKKRSQYVHPVLGESWRNHLYIKLHFLQRTIDIQK